MRIPDNDYHRLARVQFIYADSLDILNNLGIADPEGYLHYDASATEILLKPEVYLKDFVFETLCQDTKLAEKLAQMQKVRRKTLTEAHDKHRNRPMQKNDLEDLFTQHFGYEQLTIDKCFNEEKLFAELSKNLPGSDAQKIFSDLLIPFDGKTFFEESNIIRLKHIGFLLDRENPLTQGYDWNWYREKSLTRHRLYDILTNYAEIIKNVMAEVDVVRDIFNIKSHNDVVTQIKRLRYKQLSRRETVRDTYNAAGVISPRVANYLEFMKTALPYNEDVRLQRSVSFDIFCKNAVVLGENPKELYREFQLDRQKRFVLQYRPGQYDHIMTQKVLQHLEVGK